MNRDISVWVTAQGDRILMKEMTDQHLINAIKYFDNYQNVKKYSDIEFRRKQLKIERLRRGLNV